MKTRCEIVYTAESKKDLYALDTHLALRITKKINYYALDFDNPLQNAKPLTGTLAGLYRYRVGDYRAIFEMDSNRVIIVLSILSIKHRKDIYR
jgi:mRNA interferase RelE/StbE